MLLDNIIWKADEETYRNTGIHYSDISDFISTGFRQSWEKVRIQTKALTIGSAVDCILTDGGWEEFEKRYYLNSESIDEKVVGLYQYAGGLKYNDISDDVKIEYLDNISYCQKMKPETRLERLNALQGQYDTYFNNKDKQAVTLEEYDVIRSCVDAVKKDPKLWFMEKSGNRTEGDIEIYFQPKFKTTINNVEYAIMFDVLLVNTYTKTIYPMDLKTASVEEWNFVDNFKKYHYDVQAHLYTAVLTKILEDNGMNDFTMENFTFIVVGKQTFTPLTWEYEDSRRYEETIKYPTYVSKPVLELGHQLAIYKATTPKVPVDIDIENNNSICNRL